MSKFGTLMTWDSLWQSNQTIVNLGEARVFDVIDRQRQAHNALLQEVLGEFAQVRTDTYRGEFQSDVFGADDTIFLDPIGELGQADAEKVGFGDTVGFPIEPFSKSVQWTKRAFEMLTGAELAQQFAAIAKGDAIQYRRSILNAFFGPANYSVVDRLTNKQTVNVKRLTNADSGFLPPGPNGEVFDPATHTHYLGSATYTNAAVDNLITTVSEHYSTGRLFLYINRAQEASIRTHTSFTAYLPVNINPPSTLQTANGTLSPRPVNDRAIGVINDVEVWVKPWMPANYILAFMSGTPRPIVRVRQRGGLELAVENEQYPLRCRSLEHIYGAGVLERTGAAVLQVNNATYTAPTLTY